jgi:hypothetical protein
MGKLDISSDISPDGGDVHDWARLDGYGDNGAVTFFASQYDAADVDRAPRLLAEAPVAGGRAWLRLDRPFVFDSIAPFWCLYLPPAMRCDDPSEEDLTRLALVRCRLLRAPWRDGDNAAVARVEILESLGLDDLARGMASGEADPVLMSRLIEGEGAQPAVRQGGYSVLTRDIDGCAGEWAILRHDTGAVDLLVYGAWDIDRDRMWAGRARVPQFNLS